MEQTINDGNKVIADFMGLKPYEDGRYGTLWVDPTSKTNSSSMSLKYHKSWDWLMPVITKICDLDTSIFNYNATAMADLRCKRDNIARIPVSMALFTVWEEVVDFIQWYNEQSTPNESRGVPFVRRE